MIETEVQTQEVRAPFAVTCNVCGGRWSLNTSDGKQFFEAQEVSEFSVEGGYGNRQWGDLVALRWHACQDCTAAWIGTFKIAPEVGRISLTGESPNPRWPEDRAQDSPEEAL